jgi:HD-GYP domain-containing protein (c-di-GMP phosphodiesterase class II)
MANESNKMNLEQAINSLSRAIQLYRYYGRGHQVTTESIETLYKNLDEILDDLEVITIGIIGDEIAFDKEPLYDLSQKKRGFIEYLKALGIKKMSFLRGLSRDELLQFVQILPAKADSPETKQEVLDHFNTLGLPHIVIGDISLKPKDDPDELKERRLEYRFRKEHMKHLESFTKAFKNLKNNQTLNLQNARQIVVGLMNNLFKNKNLLLMLTSMKLHDEDIFEHGVNVAIFTLMQGEILGLEKKMLVDVGMAALLHDVGGMTQPSSTLGGTSIPMEFSFNDPATKLRTENDFEQDVRGAKLLLESDGLSTLAAITAFEHGMNYDLSGPHTKIYGKQLNLISMMIAISDFYDKLRKQPFYYKSGGPEEAYEMMMRESGKKFHPDLLENFFSVIGVFPPGTLVELDSGEIALVVQSSVFDIRRPQVEILYNNQGERYQNPLIVNLVEKDRRGQYKRSIVRSISPREQLSMSENLN